MIQTMLPKPISIPQKGSNVKPMWKTRDIIEITVILGVIFSVLFVCATPIDSCFNLDDEFVADCLDKEALSNYLQQKDACNDQDN